MNKKLDTTTITSELEESAFFPRRRQEPVPPTPLPETPSPVQEQQLLPPLPERANHRTPERPNGKRIITRNSFEIYEDQMDSLRTLSFQEKMAGKLGSMSAMVREAIDSYIQKRTSEH